MPPSGSLSAPMNDDKKVPPPPANQEEGSFPPPEQGKEPPPPPSEGNKQLYMPGELVDYTAMSGDTLPELANRFHTTVEEIRKANPALPAHVTTLPQGFPMKIPIYFRSHWGSSFKIIPNALFVFGPEQTDFNARVFVDRQSGWFKYYSAYSEGATRRGGEIIDYIAENYSISPRLLLALLELKTGALTTEKYPDNIDESSILGFPGENYQRLSAQLNQLANFLNGVYYNYKSGDTEKFELKNGAEYRFNPWVNAATASLQAYFAFSLESDAAIESMGEDGFVLLYKKLFGDFPPVDEYPASIPGSLEQPKMSLPFPTGEYWTFTGGPHAAWGSNPCYAAVDFAPPTETSGCFISNEWVTAPADGVITRTGFGVAVLDLDGDQNERTGWNITFLHLKTESIPPVGTFLKRGDPVGHPSCDGGKSTGTHVHLARKYNGEWIAAGGEIPFTMDQWETEWVGNPYSGRLVRFSMIVTASSVSAKESQIFSGPPLVPTSTPKAKQ